MMVLAAHDALTPAGKPDAVPIPVAPVVVCVITAPSAVFTHTLGDEEAGAKELLADTFIVPVAFTEPHPPVRGML
jgi:hypothetical protein